VATRPAAGAKRRRVSTKSQRCAGDHTAAPDDGKRTDGAGLAAPLWDAGSSALATAAWVIEKELAVGAGLARLVENGLPGAGALQSVVPKALLPGVHLDRGKVADLAVDAIRVAAALLLGRPGAILGFAAGRKTPPTQPGEDQVPVLQMPGPLSPGQTGERVLLLSNDHDRPTPEFTLASSDLVSASGDRMAADCVHFDPSALSVAAHGSELVVVRVTIPRSAPSERYEGLLRGAGLGRQGALLRVDVA